MSDQLDNWEFERLYSNLFATELIGQNTANLKWRYDALDSKYPTIDGILRRETIESAALEGRGEVRTERYVLVQLKGTRETEPQAALRSLENLWRDARKQINAVALSAPALLIGLSVDMSKSPLALSKIYFGAPDADLASANLQKNQPISPEELTGRITAILDLRRTAAMLPKPEETCFYRKGPQGWYSITNGVFAGQDISVNWTIPRGSNYIRTSVIKGAPVIQAIPVELPHAPYREIKGPSGGFERLDIKNELKLPKQVLGITEFHWVLQIRFCEEAIVRVEALAPTVACSP
jgi:hypothetical protein